MRKVASRGSRTRDRQVILFLSNFRKCTAVARRAEMDKSDESAESENEGAASDNPSDSNTGGGCKGGSLLRIEPRL